MIQNISYKPYVSNIGYVQKSKNVSFAGNLVQTEKVAQAIERTLTNTVTDGVNNQLLKMATVPLFLNYRKLGRLNEKLLELAKLFRENPDVDIKQLADILERTALNG